MTLGDKVALATLLVGILGVIAALLAVIKNKRLLVITISGMVVSVLAIILLPNESQSHPQGTNVANSANVSATQTQMPISRTATNTIMVLTDTLIPPTITMVSPTLTPTRTISTGRIAFMSNRDGNFEIYVMNADGTNLRNLTQNPAFDGNPAWSPDGRFIAFNSDRAKQNIDGCSDDCNFEIYAMDADETNLRRLTNNRVFDLGPSWSPSGQLITFSSSRDSGEDIYVMNTDGNNEHKLTSYAGRNLDPSWSPDGRFIAFRSNRDGNFEIYVMNADGTSPRRLTNDSAEADEPAWSPDSRFIAFTSTRDDPNPNTCGDKCNYEIYVMNADGTNVRRLTDSPGFDESPVWSPDGRFIAFASNRDGGPGVYVMNADGTNQHKIADGISPSWSPN